MVEKKCFAMFCQNCHFFGCTPRPNLQLLFISVITEVVLRADLLSWPAIIISDFKGSQYDSVLSNVL